VAPKSFAVRSTEFSGRLLLKVHVVEQVRVGRWSERRTGHIWQIGSKKQLWHFRSLRPSLDELSEVNPNHAQSARHCQSENFSSPFNHPRLRSAGPAEERFGSRYGL